MKLNGDLKKNEMAETKKKKKSTSEKNALKLIKFKDTWQSKS